MEFRDIKKIIELMKENELTEFKLEESGFKISLRRGNGLKADGSMSPTPIIIPSAPPAQSFAPAAPVAPMAAAPSAAPEDEHAGKATIKSPMVGTYYRSSSPESDAFVKVGDEVSEDTTVCIIEAMKVMNEIKAETKGVIRKCLIENATAVEFDQPLFLIDPV